MKKIVVILTVAAFTVGLSSCYRQSVCATYVKAEKKVEQKVEDKNI